MSFQKQSLELTPGRRNKWRKLYVGRKASKTYIRIFKEDVPSKSPDTIWNFIKGTFKKLNLDLIIKFFEGMSY
jgi:hypothetical protein